MNLQGHAALITGSTKGVGRSIAEAFAAAGCHVVLHGRQRGPDAETVLAKCREYGVEAHIVSGDLSGPVEAAVEQVYSAALAAQPNIDILVNNAGSLFDVPFLEMDLERFERTLRLNVSSGYFLAQAFARHWVKNNMPGRVLFVGSINGRLAEQVHTAYDTSKGAVETMVKTLCVALAPLNIRVNGMAPGLVRTPLTAVVDERPEFARWMELHTPNRLVPHSDACGPAAVFLVSDGAWHIHGQMLLVDGGMSAWQQPDPPAVWK
jgi:NAD(P)-dependent dehydrogenase (short-subunit alcohol dehydrogenase family)